MGEAPGDPVFCVTDLLPHLSADQNKRTLGEGLKGEELNIVVGSIPYADKEAKERIKLYTMQLLNERYGITERDFTRAEIEAVPAFKAADVGFDRSMIGAYGHDDRVCAYTALRAEIDAKAPAFTTLCVLTDKEEVGSEGTTGLQGDYTFHFLKALARAQGADYEEMLRRSVCVSADVNAALDPTFPEVHDPRNAARMNCGVCLTKYTGARGNALSQSASAETLSYVTNVFDDAGVAWQTGELGKVDQGGGGTIAKFVSNRNVDTVGHWRAHAFDACAVRACGKAGRVDDIPRIFGVCYSEAVSFTFIKGQGVHQPYGWRAPFSFTVRKGPSPASQGGIALEKGALLRFAGGAACFSEWGMVQSSYHVARAWKTCVRDVERVDRHAEYQLGRFFGIPLSLKAAAFAGRHEGGLCGEQAEQTGEQLCRRYLFGTLCGPQHQTADAHRKRARFCVGRRRYAAFPFVPLQGG